MNASHNKKIKEKLAQHGVWRSAKMDEEEAIFTTAPEIETEETVIGTADGDVHVVYEEEVLGTSSKTSVTLRCPIFANRVFQTSDFVRLILNPEHVQPNHLCTQVPPICPGVGEFSFVVYSESISQHSGKNLEFAADAYIWNRPSQASVYMRLEGRDCEPVKVAVKKPLDDLCWDFRVVCSRYSHLTLGDDFKKKVYYVRLNKLRAHALPIPIHVNYAVISFDCPYRVPGVEKPANRRANFDRSRRRGGKRGRSIHYKQLYPVEGSPPTDDIDPPTFFHQRPQVRTRTTPRRFSPSFDDGAVEYEVIEEPGVPMMEEEDYNRPQFNPPPLVKGGRQPQLTYSLTSMMEGFPEDQLKYLELTAATLKSRGASHFSVCPYNSNRVALWEQGRMVTVELEPVGDLVNGKCLLPCHDYKFIFHRFCHHTLAAADFQGCLLKHLEHASMSMSLNEDSFGSSFQTEDHSFKTPLASSCRVWKPMSAPRMKRTRRRKEEIPILEQISGVKILHRDKMILEKTTKIFEKVGKGSDWIPAIRKRELDQSQD